MGVTIRQCFFVGLLCVILIILSYLLLRTGTVTTMGIITFKGNHIESTSNDRIFISLRQLVTVLAELDFRVESASGVLIVQENVTNFTVETSILTPNISLIELLRERQLHGEWYGQHNGWLTHITLEETQEFGPFTATLFRGPFIEVDEILDIVLIGTYEIIVSDSILRFHWRALNDEYVQLQEDWEIIVDPTWIQLFNPHTGQRIIRPNL